MECSNLHVVIDIRILVLPCVEFLSWKFQEERAKKFAEENTFRECHNLALILEIFFARLKCVACDFMKWHVLQDIGK